MLEKWDILIYLILFSISGITLYSGITKKSEKAEYAEIYINGEMKYKYRLTNDKKVIQIDVENGKEEIMIENKSVKKLKSTCKNKHCEKQGVISKSGESIICVPNKEIIKISGEGELDYIVK